MLPLLLTQTNQSCSLAHLICAEVKFFVLILINDFRFYVLLTGMKIATAWYIVKEYNPFYYTFFAYCF